MTILMPKTIIPDLTVRIYGTTHRLFRGILWLKSYSYTWASLNLSYRQWTSLQWPSWPFCCLWSRTQGWRGRKSAVERRTVETTLRPPWMGDGHYLMSSSAGHQGLLQPLHQIRLIIAGGVVFILNITVEVTAWLLFYTKRKKWINCNFRK